MNKKFIICGIVVICLTTVLGILVLTTKEKYMKNEIEKLRENLNENREIGKELNLKGAEIWQDKYDQSEESYFKLSEKQVITTRDSGIEFINYIIPYTNNADYKDKLENIKKLTTESLGNTIYDKLIEYQKTFSNEVKKLEINEVIPIQYERLKDGTLLWSFYTVENIIDNDDKVVETHEVEIKLLFSKVNDKWRIMDYTSRKY